MSASATVALAHELAAVCGAAHVREALPPDLAIDELLPAVEVSPASADEVAAVLRLASERGLAVVPAGSFSSQHTGRIPDRADILLRTSRLRGIEHYDPGDLTLGVHAGATLSELDAAVAPHRQFVPLDPCCAATRTVGGVLATAAQGPLRHAFGGPRDFCLGVTFVTADGRIAKGGGRVVKNVAGYDLMKLLIGSYGTLGVLVSANFKLFPAPRRPRTFLCSFPSLAQAIEFRDRLLASPLTPLSLDIVSPLAANYLSAGFDPSAWTVALRASGSDAVLARYRSELGSAVTRELDAPADTGLWLGIADFERSVAARHRNAMSVAVSITIADVEAALAAAERIAPQHNLLCAAVGRIGVGSLTLAFVPLAVDPPSAMQYAAAASALRAALPPGASAVVQRCPVEAKRHFDVWGSCSTDLDAMRAVRRTLDSQQLLNRGRFLV